MNIVAILWLLVGNFWLFIFANSFHAGSPDWDRLFLSGSYYVMALIMFFRDSRKEEDYTFDFERELD